MGKTTIHIAKAKFKNRIISFKMSFYGYKKQCYRRNMEYGYYKIEKIEIAKRDILKFEKSEL